MCPGKTGLASDGHGVQRVRCELEQAAMSNGKVVDVVFKGSMAKKAKNSMHPLPEVSFQWLVPSSPHPFLPHET